MRLPVPVAVLSLVAILAVPSLWAAPTVTLHGYGMVNPNEVTSVLAQEQKSERAAQVELRRLALYLNGATIQKLPDGYALADEGKIADLRGNIRQISPVLAEASATLPIPPALSNRVMQKLKVTLKYTGKIDSRSFEANQAFSKWLSDNLIQSLGDDLVKRGFLGSGALRLEFLSFECPWTGKTLNATIQYVATKGAGK